MQEIDNDTDSIDIGALTWEGFLALPEGQQMQLRGLLTSAFYQLMIGIRMYRFDLCKKLFENSLKMYKSGEITNDDIFAAQKATFGVGDLCREDEAATHNVTETTVTAIAALDAFIECRDTVVKLYELLELNKGDDDDSTY